MKGLRHTFTCVLLFSCSVVSYCLWPYELWHTRLSCPSLSPGVWSNSCSLSQWCHPITSSSVTRFSSCLQSFTVSRSFPVSRLFPSGGHSIGASVSASALPMNIQDLFPLGLTGLISLSSKGLSRVFSSTTVWKHQFYWCSASFMVQLSHPYMTIGKIIALTIWIFVSKVISLLFNMLSRFVIAFLPRNKCLLISWLQSPFTGMLEPKKIESATVSTFPHLFAMKLWDWMPWPQFFEC